MRLFAVFAVVVAMMGCQESALFEGGPSQTDSLALAATACDACPTITLTCAGTRSYTTPPCAITLAKAKCDELGLVSGNYAFGDLDAFCAGDDSGGDGGDAGG